MIDQARRGRWLVALAAVLVLAFPGALAAAPYAALVMDARDGRVIHAENADTRLHPASLTKMMTLYLVFDAVRTGKLSMDQRVTISRRAAGRPPSKLGLRAGSSIEVRYLVRAAAVRSANDAAVALAEAVSGSEEAFARKMTATARAMGMTQTTFRNASGLTQTGHLSTARDMAVLGRRLFFDFPQYYNLFARRSTSAKIKTVYNTNRRLLDSFQGADGIKTGYTRAAGYNLVASATRGPRRVIVSLFGGRSSASRNAKVAELMDMGLKRMRRNVAVVRPARLQVPTVDAQSGSVVAYLSQPLRVTPRPVLRPGPRTPAPATEIAAAVARAASTAPVPTVRTTKTGPVNGVVIARTPVGTPARPRLRPPGLGTAQPAAPVATAPAPSPGGNWIVQLGGTHNRSQAERLLLTTALQEMEALEGSKRVMQPTSSPGWFRARFIGLNQAAAHAACARLAARQTPCEVIQGG